MHDYCHKVEMRMHAEIKRLTDELTFEKGRIEWLTEEKQRLSSLLEEKDREIAELQRDKVLMDYVLTLDWLDERGGFPFFPVTRESMEQHLKFLSDLKASTPTRRGERVDWSSQAQIAARHKEEGRE